MCFPGSETLIAAAMSAASSAAAAAPATLSTIGSTVGNALANPLTQLALTAAGTGAQIYGQNQARQAADDAAARESMRQRRFRENQRGITEGIIQNSRPGVADEDIVRRTRSNQSSNQRVLEGVPRLRGAIPGGPTSRAVQSSERRSAASGERNTQRISDAIARSGAYRSSKLGRDIDLSRAFSNLATQTSLAQGSASVLPLELQAAQSKGGVARMIGDLLVGTGSLAGATNGFQSLFGAQLPTNALELALAGGPTVSPMPRPGG